jgi:hypothetical protein
VCIMVVERYRDSILGLCVQALMRDDFTFTVLYFYSSAQVCHE